MKRICLLSVATAVLAYPVAAAAPPFETGAPVAYMVDLSSGAVLYAKNADRRMPPASMAKMMTVYLAFELIEQGKFKLSDTVSVRPETWQKWHGPAAGSTMFLSPGEKVTIADLLHGIVTLSGNDACVVLAEAMMGTEAAYVAQMNAAAAKIGLSNSHFGTSNGWPDGGVTYVTARDLAKLGRATIDNFPKALQGISTARPISPGARAWGVRRSPKPIAIRCSAALTVPMASRPGIPTRRAMALPVRLNKRAGDW